MQPLKARVRNGRLVLDDPSTDLAEGSEVELVLVDGGLDHEERARLIQAIEDGAADIDRGDHVDGMEFAEQLLARREAASR
jgi:glyoxylase-like metal-dependent hydrolase (beta-lactamase superfamily II)